MCSNEKKVKILTTLEAAEEIKKEKNMSKDFLRELKKINPFSEFLDKSVFANITDWISTGSYVLNGIISGDMTKGIPAGKISIISGKSGVGKSYIASCVAANAQKKDYIVIWFDTEGASDRNAAEGLGIDSTKLMYLPGLSSIEDFRNQCTKILELVETKFKDKKILIVLDSLGNLSSAKELADADKGKTASDMGQRGKAIRSVFRVLSPRLIANGVTTIIINHTYDNIAVMFGGEVESGGEGSVYNSTVILNCKRAKVRDNQTKDITGVILKPTTTKNRIVAPFKTGMIALDFTAGLNKYYGLLDWALEAGLVIKDKTRYKTVKMDKLEWEKNFYTAKIWDPILDDLSAWVSEKMSYSSIFIDEETKAAVEAANADEEEKEKNE